MEPAATRRPRTQIEQVRGTQSLVHIIAGCWSRPGLVACELAWRWLYGIPALLLIWLAIRRLPLEGLPGLAALDPASAARVLGSIFITLSPALLRIGLWMVPLLGLGWAAASGLGRAGLFRRLGAGASIHLRPLMLLQLLRFAALVGSVLLWVLLVRWAALGTVVGLPPGAEPRTVSFAAWLICLSLGSFSLWAVWSWVLSLAAVLSAVEGRGPLASLHAAVRAGALSPKLIEVNLVLGIVKLALIVLAMVFASIPLPFEAVMSGVALYVWWVLVGVGYLAASDFFQVVRLAAFLQLRSRAAGSQQIH